MSVIRESVLGICGLGGVLKFNALYADGFETGDGMPDLSAIGEAIGRTFPPEQASAIMTALTMKLGGSPHASGPAVTAAGSTKNGSQDETSAFATYFSVDSSQVRDIVSEARRMRIAMGKPISVMPGQPAEAPADTGFTAGRVVTEAAAEKRTENAAEILWTAPGRKTADRPAVPEPIKTPDIADMTEPVAIVEPVSEIDREIAQFAYCQTAYTSIDIIDFIRYMKDKGYSFEESIVLEKIYVTIEERKKEARSTIEKEVEGIFNGAQAPSEPDICRLMGRLRENGLVFEEDDVRRLARIAALRRAQESLSSINGWERAPTGD